MNKLKDYYINEQKRKNSLNNSLGADISNKQSRNVSELRRLMLGIIQEIILLAENAKPEALEVSWNSRRKLNFVQLLLRVRPYNHVSSFAWDVGSNYLLTIEGRMIIRRRINRDYRDGSFFYEESFPYQESMDDPYSACECLINFMEKIGANQVDVSKRRDELKAIKG